MERKKRYSDLAVAEFTEKEDDLYEDFVDDLLRAVLLLYGNLGHAIMGDACNDTQVRRCIELGVVGCTSDNTSLTATFTYVTTKKMERGCEDLDDRSVYLQGLRNLLTKEKHCNGESSDGADNVVGFGPNQRLHLLQQLACAAVRDRGLQAYLYDHLKRLETTEGVTACLVSQKKLVDVVMLLLRFARWISSCGAAGRNAAVTGIKSMCPRYGPAFVFLKLPSNDLNNPLSHRLTFWSLDNEYFPANADSPGLVDVKTKYRTRTKAATCNPVAYVTEYLCIAQEQWAQERWTHFWEKHKYMF
jgi:hypothetical protein